MWVLAIRKNCFLYTGNELEMSARWWGSVQRAPIVYEENSGILCTYLNSESDSYTSTARDTPTYPERERIGVMFDEEVTNDALPCAHEGVQPGSEPIEDGLALSCPYKFKGLSVPS